MHHERLGRDTHREVREQRLHALADITPYQQARALRIGIAEREAQASHAPREGDATPSRRERGCRHSAERIGNERHGAPRSSASAGSTSRSSTEGRSASPPVPSNAMAARIESPTTRHAPPSLIAATPGSSAAASASAAGSHPLTRCAIRASGMRRLSAELPRTMSSTRYARRV